MTLTTQPFKILQLFVFATLKYLKQWLVYVLKKGGWIIALTFLLAAIGFILANDDSTSEKVSYYCLHIYSFASPHFS